MKLKTGLPISLGIIILMHTASSHDYQQTADLDYYEQKKRWSELTQPIQFTRNGVQNFLQEIFNCREYTEEIMPHSFGHLIQFLEYGKATNQDMTYIESAIRLYLNKLKQVRYVAAESACHLLERMPNLLADHFKRDEESTLQLVKKELKQILYKMFLSHFAFFKQEPDRFFDQVCDEISTSMQEKSNTAPISQEQCRQLTIRFLEVMLGKLLWNASDQSEVWHSFKTISEHLVTCQQQQILNDDELDDLLCSSLERFIYFLDLRGSDLNKGVIDTIKADIASGSLVICQVQEQEDYLEPKAVRLERVLMQVEAKILARQKGIVTE